ncbi:MAG: hypothetical protein J5850_00025 [Clostridia bacterium]|nr:hypothetical protein [Clostridia bacterium]
MKRVLLFLTVLSLILASSLITVHADEEQKAIENVSLSPEGILTWDPYEGATRYWITFQPDDSFQPEGCSADLYQRARDVNFASGTHSFSLVACDDNWNNLSLTYYGTFEYTAPIGLAKVENPHWDGKIARWDPVDEAVGYNLYLYSGDVNISVYYVEELSLDFSDSIALTLGNDYKFTVMAIAEGDNANGEMSDFSDELAGWFEYHDIENVQISEDGILTWDHFEGAERYWLIFGDGAYEPEDETIADLNKLFTEIEAESGTYNIDLVACLSSWIEISNHYTGTFDYVKPSAPITEPLPTTTEIPVTDIPVTDIPVTDTAPVTDNPIVTENATGTNTSVPSTTEPDPVSENDGEDVSPDGAAKADNEEQDKNKINPVLIIVIAVAGLAIAGGIIAAVIYSKNKK